MPWRVAAGFRRFCTRWRSVWRLVTRNQMEFNFWANLAQANSRPVWFHSKESFWSDSESAWRRAEMWWMKTIRSRRWWRDTTPSYGLTGRLASDVEYVCHPLNQRQTSSRHYSGCPSREDLLLFRLIMMDNLMPVRLITDAKRYMVIIVVSLIRVNLTLVA